jgi:hypothetical protein
MKGTKLLNTPGLSTGGKENAAREAYHIPSRGEIVVYKPSVNATFKDCKPI